MLLWSTVTWAYIKRLKPSLFLEWSRTISYSDLTLSVRLARDLVRGLPINNQDGGTGFFLSKSSKRWNCYRWLSWCKDYWSLCLARRPGLGRNQSLCWRAKCHYNALFSGLRNPRKLQDKVSNKLLTLQFDGWIMIIFCAYFFYFYQTGNNCKLMASGQSEVLAVKGLRFYFPAEACTCLAFVRKQYPIH